MKLPLLHREYLEFFELMEKVPRRLLDTYESHVKKYTVIDNDEIWIVLYLTLTIFQCLLIY